MTKKYDVYDAQGNRIGSAEEQPSAGDQVVGGIMFFYLLWKALPAILVIGAIALVIGGGTWAVGAAKNLVRYGTINELTAKLVETNREYMTSAQSALDDGDYFVAAAFYRQILSTQPDYKDAVAALQQLAGQVPGGLVVDGQPGSYIPFAGGPSQPIANWPQNIDHLLTVSLDGQRALVTRYYDSYLLDLSTGAITRFDRSHFNPSPDLAKVVRDDANLYDVRRKKESRLCATYNSQFQWMRDSVTLLGVDGNAGTLAIIDTESGTCEKVQIPGLGWDSGVALSPDKQRLYIITSGQLFTANVDGSGLKKLGSIRFARGHWKPLLLAPDGSALYMDGHIISTRTGRVAPSLDNAVAWLEHPLIQSAVGKVGLTVTPTDGPRGTRFSFALVGGPPGQVILWVVDTRKYADPTELPKTWSVRTNFVALGQPELDADGSLSDANKLFGMNTDLSTEAGTYYVYVIIQQRLVGLATFRVTE